MGRPSKYQKEFDKQAFKLALLGAKDTQVADFFEVNADTIHEWKKQYPSFSESLKKGKLHADSLVAKSLYKRALGFKFNEVTYEDILETIVDHEGDISRVPKTKIKTVKKYILPDTTAQIFWLKNRQQDQWRDKQEIEHSIPEEQIFKIADQIIKF